MLACITYLLAIVKLSSISCFLFNFDTESGSCKVLMGYPWDLLIKGFTMRVLIGYETS